MVLGINKEREEEILSEFEKEYDEVYRSFCKTKASIKRKYGLFKLRKNIWIVLFILFAISYIIAQYSEYAVFVGVILSFPTLYFVYIRKKDTVVDEQVNRMLVTRVSKEIEYKAYPFVFDKEMFLRVSNHTYLPTVRYSREIIIEDELSGLTYKNVELSTFPNYTNKSDGMFAYVELEDIVFPRIVIRKRCEKIVPSIDDDTEYKYYFDLAICEDDSFKEKIKNSDLIEKLKVYTRFFPSADIFVDKNIISIYAYQSFRTTQKYEQSYESASWYSYQYGKQLADDYHYRDVDFNEYFLKTNKKYNRYNYYRWFGPIRILEELLKIL